MQKDGSKGHSFKNKPPAANPRTLSGISLRELSQVLIPREEFFSRERTRKNLIDLLGFVISQAKAAKIDLGEQQTLISIVKLALKALQRL